MSHAHDEDPVRGMRLPVGLAGALAIGSVIAVAAFRWSGIPIHEPDAAAVVTRELRFLDRTDGSIAVVDGKTGTTVETIVGENGFVRGTLRGLARERRRQGIGAEAVFDLVARADGRLTLLDPATGRRVDLESFGPTNMAAFARLLYAGGPSGRTTAPRN